jgi:hypothetical protein
MATNYNKIINIINEEFSGLIDETYGSVKEINQLANDVLNEVGKLNYDAYNKSKEFLYLYGLNLRTLDSSKYNEIQDFVKNSNIYISFKPNKDGQNVDRYGEYGVYKTEKGEKFNPNIERDITIFYPYYTLKEKIDEKIKDRIERNSKLEAYDVYNSIYYMFISTLAHELQHAYDDYRSGGMLYNTKEFEKYKEKYYQPSSDSNSMSDDSVLSDLNKAKRYLNLPHEIWARFTLAMQNIKFYSSDFDDENWVSYDYKMRPLNRTIYGFMNSFSGFNILSPTLKRKLVNKVSQFWHMEQEKVNKLNKEYDTKFRNKKNR